MIYKAFQRSEGECFNINRLLFRYLLVLFCSVALAELNCGKLLAQEKTISFSGENISLSDALMQISASGSIRFAFDAEKFAEIKGTIKVANLSIREFLLFLSENFPVTVKEIDGTYVLNFAEKKAEVIPVPVKYTLNGFVTDRTTGERLKYCNIGCTGGRGAITNDLGFFSIDVFEKDSVKLSVSYVGYMRLDTLINPSKANSLSFQLQPLSLMMKEVKVVSYNYKVLQFADESGRVAFNPLQSSNIPRIDENDLSNALTIIPGVNLTCGRSGGLSIRGSSTSENLVLVDGIPIMETNHLFGNMSVLNGKYIQQVFVSRGGFDASYGERIAGLIEMNGKSAIKSKSQFDLSANLLNFNLFGVVPVSEKFSVTFAWRRSFIDQWKNYLFRKLLVESSPGDDTYITHIYPTVKYEDLNFKLSYHPAANHELNLNFIRSNDFQEKDFELTQKQLMYRNEHADENNTGTSVNWSIQSGKNWHHYFSAGLSGTNMNSIDESGNILNTASLTAKNDQMDKKDSGKNTKTKQSFEVDNSANSINEYRISVKSDYKSGKFLTQAGAGITGDSFSFKFKSGKSTANIPVDSVDNEADFRIFHFFVKQKIDILPVLNLTWGVRTNYVSNNGNFYWQPRGSIELKPSGNLKFQFSGGKYYQFLSQIRRIDLSGNMSLLWYLPQYEDVGLLNANHYILGGLFEKKGLLINIEAYRKKVKGKVNLFADLYKLGNEQRIRYIAREGEELNQGIDLFVNYRSPAWNHFLSYSLSTSEERYYGINRGYYFPSFDNEIHRLKINEIFNYKTWYFSGSWNYGSGLPWIKPVSNWNTVNYERLNYFSQVDFSVVKQFKLRNLLLNAGFSLLNVFNRKNTFEVNSIRFTNSDVSLNVRSELAAISFTPVFFINLKYR